MRPIRYQSCKTVLFAILLSFTLLTGSGSSQVNPGMPSFSAYDSHEADTINLQNLDILLTVPFMSKSGAFPFNYNMAANSYMAVNTGTWQPGISYGGLLGSASGMLYGAGPTVNTTITCPDGVHLTNKYANWVVYSADGTTHPLPVTDYVDFPIMGNGNAPCYKGSFADQTMDGSGYTVRADSVNCHTYNSPLCSVTHKSGFQAGFITNDVHPAVTDSNGNQIVMNQQQTLTSTFTDTLGIVTATEATNLRSHDFLFGGTLAWTDINGGSPQVSVTSSSTFHLKSVFGCSGITNYDYSTYNLPTSIAFPDNTAISLSYEPTPGNAGDYTGRLGGITLRSGGTITYGYTTGFNCSYRTPAQVTRTTSDGTTTYTWAAVNNGSGNWGNTTTVVDQGGNKTVYTFTGLTATGNAALPVTQALTQIQTYQGLSTLLSTTLICYNSNVSNCATAVVSLPILKRDVYTYPAGMTLAQARLSEQTFDKYGNALTQSEYDYNQALVSTTTTTYGSWNGSQCVAISSTIADKACDIVTTIGTNTVAESRYVYDSRGNILTAYKWTGSNWLSNTTPNSYNTNGTLATAYDLGNNPTTYAYSAGGYTSCNTCTNYPFPTSMSHGGLTTYSTWNGIGGVKLTDKDANGNTTTYGYTACSNGTAEPFWRLASVTDPLAGKICKTYPSGTAPNTVNSNFVFNSGSSLQNVTTKMDGYGRTVNTQTEQGPASPNYDTQSTTYGWSGNYRSVLKVMPCSNTLGAACTGSGITTLTDPLSRPYMVTDADGKTITSTYTKNDVLTVVGPPPAGEHIKQVQKQYDGLGRIQYSCAIGNGSSTACNQTSGTANGVTTSYAYSAAPGSTTTTATRESQSRVKSYDAMGRIIASTVPESGLKQYVYDSDPACNLIGLTGISKGDLISTIDANGNKTCYGYDSLHRLTDVAVLKSGTCYPPVKRFRYDNSSNPILPAPTGYTSSNTGGRMFEAWTGDCVWPTPSSGFDSASDEWFSYDANGRMTDLWESTSHIAGYYHGTASYASNGVLTSLGGVPGYATISYGLDGEGRLYTASQGTTNLVNGVTYNAAGQPQTITLGTAGDSDSYLYDSAGRMTKYTFTVGSTPKSMSGVLTWNPNGTLRTLAITDGFNSGGTQTCNFGTSTVMGYDDLGRLLSADCGSAWQQTFSYDQYENITKSGSSSWVPGYDTSTNHALPPITYDNNGNLTYDTFHHYAWYVDNKLGSTDSTTCNIFGSTDGTCVVYDAFGREVEKGINGVYTEVMYTPVGKTAIMNGQTTTISAYFPLPGGATYYQTAAANGNGYFWHTDWLGSVRLSSSVQNRAFYFDRAFAPYGEMYKNFGNTSGLNFTGDTQDSFAGLYDTPSRELTPSQGRWLSPDPAGAGWNQYAYAANPNSMIDPLGLNNCREPKGPGCGSPIGGSPFPNSDFQDPFMAFGAMQVFASVLANNQSGVPSIPDVTSLPIASMLANLLLQTESDLTGGREPTDDYGDIDPDAEARRALEPINTETLFPGTMGGGWQYNLLNPGPLPIAIARSFAGGQYSIMTVGDEGWDFDALYRVSGGDAFENGSWYTPVPQVGGLQSQIDLNLRPEWGNTAENVTCVYLKPGTQVFVGPAAAQTGQSLEGYGAGGPQSLGISGTIQVFVPKP